MREQQNTETCVLPHGWVNTTLRELCWKITDGTHRTPTYVDRGIRFISIKNIRPFKPVDWHTYEKHISIKEHQELTKRCRPEMDDILFPRIGTLGFAKRIDFSEEVSIFVGLGLLKPVKPHIDPKYLECYMNTPYIGVLSRKRATGTGRKTLALEETSRFPVRLAPLAEQHRIVDKIDEMFSELDKGVESLRTAREQLKAYRQAVLKQAFEGKLTDKWREEHASEFETASTLLKRIKAEREQRYERQLGEWKKAVKAWESGGQKGKRPSKPSTPAETPPLTQAELAELPKLPKGWAWIRLGSTYSMPPQNGLYKASSHYGSGTQIVRIDDFYDGRLVRTDGLKRVRLSSIEVQKYRVWRNNVLVNRVNSIEYLGKCCLIPELGEPAVFESNIMRLDFSTDWVAPDFVSRYLSSRMGNKQLTLNAKHAVNQASINQTDVSMTCSPFCGISEQARIVQEIESRFSVLDQLEQTIEESLQKADALRQSILKKAFEGKLVPQDPNDEPASVLLERIKAEKARQRGNTGKTKK